MGIAWWIIGLPLLGALLQTLFGGVIWRGAITGSRRLVISVLACLPILLAFGAGLSIYSSLSGAAADARSLVLTGPEWISVGGLSIPFELRIDPLSVTMILVITGIGFLIHLYSTGYMSEERDLSRFFAYLNLFVAAMLILVMGNNLALLFVGWEGVGLCSYLLIGFWYEDRENVKAANKAFIVNRIGDWGLMLGLFLIVATVANASGVQGRLLSYDVILPVLGQVLPGNPMLAAGIGLLLFIGAAGKSAQFPLHIWLPDAMAGPTPVSALIHAATMVASGVVLLNRMNVVYVNSPLASAVICAIAAFTALYAAVVAFGQTDIKKVLAWSTVSQLGFMFIACGAGAYWAGMFHVVTHAFFKALLFLGAGAVIHAMAHEQDMRRYGKLGKYLPITMGTMLIGTFAIAGVPGLSGFFSKEAILGAAIGGDHAMVDAYNVSRVAGLVGLFVALLTAAYMMRLMMLTFFGNKERWRDLPATAAVHGSEHDTEDVVDHDVHGHDDHGHDDHGHHGLTPNHKPHEVGPSMWIPLALLALLSAAGGYLMEHGETFNKWLYPNGNPLPAAEHAALPGGISLMAASIAAALLGLAFGAFKYWTGLPRNEGEDETKWSAWRRSARDQFGFDRALTTLGLTGGGDVARALDRGVDTGLVSGGFGGAIWLSNLGGRTLRTLQNGFVRTYGLVMIFGVIAIAGWSILSASRSKAPVASTAPIESGMGDPSMALPPGGAGMNEPGMSGEGMEVAP